MKKTILLLASLAFCALAPAQTPSTPAPATPAATPIPLIVLSTPVPVATPAPRTTLGGHASAAQTSAALAALAALVKLPPGAQIHEFHVYISPKDGSSNIMVH